MEQNKIAEVETLINYEEYKNFYLFNLHKVKSYKKIPIFVSVISSLGILVGILSLIFKGFDQSQFFLSIIFIGLNILAVVITNYVPRKCWNNSKTISSKAIKYTFLEDSLLVENHSDLVSGISKIKYQVFYKVYELENVIYIFTSKSQGLIIKKDGFSIEEIEACRSKMKSVLNKNYYKYC